jgi:hypothetical protein
MPAGRGVRKTVRNREEGEERGVEYSLLASLSLKPFHGDIVYDCMVENL